MLLKIALKMLAHVKTRCASAVVGVSAAFFLCAAQIGLLVGWCNTTSAIILHADADVWVMARETCAFDYGTAIPQNRIYQVRSVPGVGWAEGMLMTWVYWQRPDGRKTEVELVGLDEGLVGAPWAMHEGFADAVQQPEGVIVDQLYLDVLGIQGIGDEAEMVGSRAVIRGISSQVRTFTAAPYVFASLDRSRIYDKNYAEDEITYVLARAEPGVAPESLAKVIEARVPSVEALTSRQFAWRSVGHWMLETGIGITVVITAVLGLLIGTVISSQTLYAITKDHLGDYAILRAIGFASWKLLAVVLAQSVVLGISGIAIGSVAFVYASRSTAESPVPIETTPLIYAAMAALSLTSCLAASLASMRSILRIDPTAVFRV